MRPHLRLISTVLRILLPCIAGVVLHAQALVTLGTSTSCTALGGAQTCTLTARVTGSAVTTVSWSFSPTVSGVTIGPPTGPDATGLTTNTYKAPNLVSSRQTVTATVTAADGSKASAFINLVPPTITVQVTPATVNLNAGETRQFSAAVLGISDTRVTWSISGAGSIDGNGFYSAPATIAAASKVTVTATSVFDPTVTGTATVNLQAPPAITTSTIEPSTPETPIVDG